ncbi:conserved protein of unknown function [Rhodovastum atsumiense]|nr:conserved protein of unknown function [Rhodovastum atsumiense]
MAAPRPAAAMPPVPSAPAQPRASADRPGSRLRDRTPPRPGRNTRHSGPPTPPGTAMRPPVAGAGTAAWRRTAPPPPRPRGRFPAAGRARPARPRSRPRAARRRAAPPAARRAATFRRRPPSRSRRDRPALRRVRGPPQVPGGKAAERCPAFPDRRQRLRLRRLRQPVQHAVAVAHAVIVHRQHIRPPEREDQQHLHGPAPDAADRGQAFDQRGVAQPDGTAPVRHDTRFGLGRDVTDRGDLRRGKADAPQRRLAGGQHHRRGREGHVGIQRHEAGEDAARRHAVQLLEGDRPDQRLVGLLAPLHGQAASPDALDQPGHGRITGTQVLGGRAHADSLSPERHPHQSDFAPPWLASSPLTRAKTLLGTAGRQQCPARIDSGSTGTRSSRKPTGRPAASRVWPWPCSSWWSACSWCSASPPRPPSRTA